MLGLIFNEQSLVYPYEFVCMCMCVLVRWKTRGLFHKLGSLSSEDKPQTQVHEILNCANQIFKFQKAGSRSDLTSLSHSEADSRAVYVYVQIT